MVELNGEMFPENLWQTFKLIKAKALPTNAIGHNGNRGLALGLVIS